MLGMLNSNKLGILESKLNIYEQLSKEMLTKLELAVDKIGEANVNVTNMLTKHDERIEQSIKTDELILKIIDEYKQSNTIEHGKVMKRISSLEDKIQDLSNFRWKAAGVITVFVVSLTVASTVLAGFVSGGVVSSNVDKSYSHETVQRRR